RKSACWSRLSSSLSPSSIPRSTLSTARAASTRHRRGEGLRLRDERDDIAEERPLPAEHAPEPGALGERDPAAHERRAELLEGIEHARGSGAYAVAHMVRDATARRGRRIDLHGRPKQLARLRQRGDPRHPSPCAGRARADLARRGGGAALAQAHLRDDLGDDIELVLPARAELLGGAGGGRPACAALGAGEPLLHTHGGAGLGADHRTHEPPPIPPTARRTPRARRPT